MDLAEVELEDGLDVSTINSYLKLSTFLNFHLIGRVAVYFYSCILLSALLQHQSSIFAFHQFAYNYKHPIACYK